MPFTIDEAFLPATLTAPPMTDQQFADFCAEHPDLFFETNARGEIIVMPPNFSTTGARNSQIAMQLGVLGAKRREGNCDWLFGQLFASEWCEAIARCVLDAEGRN